MIRTCSALLIAFCLIASGFVVPTAESASLTVADPALYASQPQPMQPVYCGGCHPRPFANLKADGGKHQFVCQGCHEQFHAYDPRKENYDALMPKCGACHELVHGEAASDCLNCHNPHAPRKVPVVERLTSSCGTCHSGPASDLQAAPSMHSEQGCQSCHYNRHGYIPSCFECHSAHYGSQPIETCVNCHQQVHRPLEIALGGGTDVTTCGVCHESAYSKWSKTPSKHGQVNCGLCHQQHGQVPDCRSCHAQPHDPRQLAKFPNCLTCHIDVHDLPVKR
ncbi:MAG: cytochrome C [Desulfuromonas sp.]|nr:MAG: cytochrome C [Desulfuromonas sp.]